MFDFVMQYILEMSKMNLIGLAPLCTGPFYHTLFLFGVSIQLVFQIMFSSYILRHHGLTQGTSTSLCKNALSIQPIDAGNHPFMFIYVAVPDNDTSNWKLNVNMTWKQTSRLTCLSLVSSLENLILFASLCLFYE